ncbi:Bax inhibitor-1 family protein, partial [Acidithiobacillus sp.]|uniref:Bax inhibitor-1 family protein n=1 Tax=Acidithiobacillus sp. TaxID=1872118 RepID=UPI003D072E0C
TGRRNSPLAIPLVELFAGTMGALMGPAIATYLRMPAGPTIVTEALGLTGVLFVGLSVYALTTRRRFSHLGGFLLTGLIVAILASLLNLFLLHLPALQMAIAGVLVLVFSGLILFDTQRILESSAVDSPALLVVSLYLDILNLFMALLEILGGSRS